eukprot:GHVU01151436.1.p1 GENE.GHVU01151436.1~~GHVU01151436.1.p1  ORF type:complete len:105 (-),score=2.21 GHVU01151436.1:16-330(-)
MPLSEKEIENLFRRKGALSEWAQSEAWHRLRTWVAFAVARLTMCRDLIIGLSYVTSSSLRKIAVPPLCAVCAAALYKPPRSVKCLVAPSQTIARTSVRNLRRRG